MNINYSKNFMDYKFISKVIITSIIFSVCIEYYYIIGKFFLKYEDYSFFLHPNFKHIAFLFFAGLIVFSFFFLYTKQILNILFKYRYLFAISLLVLCVIFEINGSSIGMWEKYLPDGNKYSNVLFGIPRDIRSDEWGMYTPLALSQYNAIPEPFAYKTEMIRGTSSDAFFLLGIPVANILTIFKPFNLAYLFLEPGKALSFIWCGRVIFLFMITFEMGLIITKKNKTLSLLLSILLSFSSALLWWFSSGGLLDMLIYGQLAIIVINAYMLTNSYLKRFLYSLVLTFCAVSFVIVMYPAWQVPMGYLFLSILIWIILKNKNKFVFEVKKDLPIIFLFVVLVVFIIGIIFYNSIDDIKIMMSTVYPGERFETGGNGFYRLFQYFGTIFFPIYQNNISMNVCELSVFFDFAPMGYILALLVQFKAKKLDKLLTSLLSFSIFLNIYVIFGIPKFLSKITLLYFCPSNRVSVIIGIINIFILIRALALFKPEYNIKPISKATIIILSTLLIIISCISSYGVYISSKKLFVIVFLSLFLFTLILFSNKKIILNIFLLSSAVILISTGLLINPIQKGADIILKNPLYNDIKEIADKDKSNWLVVDLSYPIINLPIMAGAPTINATNTYPNLELWEKIDINKDNSDIYNRYAHINISIQKDKDSEFSLIQPDYFNLSLNVNDLHKLNAKYILSGSNLEKFNNENIEFECIYNESLYIYQINYK